MYAETSFYIKQLKNVSKNDTHSSGYVTSVEEAMAVLKVYEEATNSKFICIKRPQKFGKRGLHQK